MKQFIALLPASLSVVSGAILAFYGNNGAGVLFLYSGVVMFAIHKASYN